MNSSSTVQNKGENFFLAAKNLGLFRFLKYHGFVKSKGFSMALVILCLLTQVFACDNLLRRMNSRWGNAILDCKKDVFYDMLSNPYLDWAGLCTRIAASFIRKLKLKDSHRSCLIVDDSVLTRPRAKNVELAARIFDHVFGLTVKGFNLLMLSWTDGQSTIPVNFALMSSAKQDNRLKEARDDVDLRTYGGKRRKDAVKPKPDMVIDLVKRTLNAGIGANYLLMDTWFTNEPLLLRLKELKLDAIGMVKQLKQRYFYKNNSYTLNTLFDVVKQSGVKNRDPDILGSIIVTTKNGLQVKIVYIVNRNKRHEYLTILSTDLALSDKEIVSIYAKRFSIEGNFFNLKHHLRINKECQCRNYDSCFAYTAIGILRLLVLEWLARCNTDCTVGELFYETREEQLLMPLAEAIQCIMKFIGDIPEYLAELNLIKQADKDKVRAALIAKFEEDMSKTSGFIQAFLKECSINSLSPDLLRTELAC